MSMLQPRADLKQEVDRSVRRHRPGPLHQVGERLSVDVLHDDVRKAVLVADVEDGDEVRM
jgi:hypothetical protein